jgi:hypothetical protein
MRTDRFVLGALGPAAALCCSAAASPLTLEYCVSTRPDGQYAYSFRLTLTNRDQSWFPDNTFNWIVFGDADRSTSPLADFLPTAPAPSPWTDDGFNFATGTHNGPCLIDFGRLYDFRGWQPGAVGEYIEWSGTAPVDLAQGELRWSNLIGSGVQANHEVAIRIDSCDNHSPCLVADFNQDGGVDGSDVESFMTSWEANLTPADVNNDGGIDGSDLSTFFIAWEAGGC